MAKFIYCKNYSIIAKVLRIGFVVKWPASKRLWHELQSKAKKVQDSELFNSIIKLIGTWKGLDL